MNGENSDSEAMPQNDSVVAQQAEVQTDAQASVENDVANEGVPAVASANDSKTSSDSSDLNGSSNSADAKASGDSNGSGKSNGSADAGSNTDSDTDTPTFEPLTDTYEELRHTTDSAELSHFAREPLPPKENQAAFSRATALLEAVAGNVNTPLEDRVFLASTMPFPNILVKLSEDADASVREAVAANPDDKNWLVGRLTKDQDGKVREAALRNPQTSWKMRLEGAQNPEISADALDFLGSLGVENEPDAPSVLSAMVRRAVALNPNCSQDTLTRLAKDKSTDVSHAAATRLG